MKHQRVRSRKLVRSYLEAIVLTVVVGLTLRLFVLSPYKIPSNTMNPTLLSGDYVFVYKLPFGVKIPFLKKIGKIQNLKHGDVVLFSYPKDPTTKFIKRVIGLSGDRVEYKNKKLFINNEALDYEPITGDNYTFIRNYENMEFLSESMGGKKYVIIHNRNQAAETLAPILVPPGEVFLLGDHRDNSDDSRYWGTVPEVNLEGSVEVIWLSVDLDASRIRFERIFQRVP